MSNNRRLVVGGERIRIDPITRKVHQDIVFLKDRIQHMKLQHNPNPVVMQTYYSMLKSRESVLAWLEQQSNERQEASQ